MASLLELAERCEKAEGHPGDHNFRELDLDILLAIEPEHEAHLMPRAGQPNPQPGTTWEWTPGGVAWTRGASFASLPVPCYTRSLDAALTLVPEGWRFSVDNAFGNGGAVCGAIVNNTVFAKNAQLGDAATPALALCAAALRARHAKGGDHG